MFAKKTIFKNKQIC